MSVKVRIAPSPTGNLHIGTARAALFNWLFTRHHDGQFIIRIEDTDLERSTKEFETNIIEGLAWLGLSSDVPIIRQAERKDVYRKYLEALMSDGRAFWCHHSIQALEEEKKAQMANKEPLRHLCEHKGTDKAKEPGQLIRLAVDGFSARKVRFDDLIRGPIEWEESHIGDLSLAKNLDTPLYNFAVVVDDIDTEITHVIRGEDHISNTPKQIMIYEALGKSLPQFGHLPLILNPDKTKLSKRAGATSVDDYRKDYLPDSLLNFIGFLGYTHSKELLSKEEMAKDFEITKVHKSGAVFDVKKLNWINAQYVRKLSAKEFKEIANLDQLPDNAVPLVTERLERLSGVQEYAYLWEKPIYDSALLLWKNATSAEVHSSLQATREVIMQSNILDKDALKAVLDVLGEENNNRGLVYWPLRVALSGKQKSPDPIDLAFVLGKEEVITRIDDAIKKLQ